MLVFNRDKAELEAEFRNPGIPETGLSVEELKAGLLRLAGRKKDGSRAVVKAEAFSYLLDNMRIGVSARDLFVTLGVWGRKPFDDAILPGWKQDVRGITRYEDLPANCRAYMEFIEKELGVPVAMVSNGPGREELIRR